MRFSNLALAIESMRLGAKGLGLTFTESQARQAYDIMYPNETLTGRNILSRVAKELCVPYEVLISLEASSVSALLASESSASNPSEWTLEDALRVRDSPFPFLALSKQMDTIEAHLFWDSVMGKRLPMTRLRFLKDLNPEVSPDTITSSRAFLTDYEIITALYHDTNRLLDPKKWYEKPNAALRKRKWKPWSKYTTVTLDTFQSIPKGPIELSYDEGENVIIERVGSTITDVAYPSHPTLPLKERLVKYADAHEDAVIAWPEMIPSWESIVKREGTIRFPNTGAFAPSEYGGYVLVKESHIHNLRIASYKHDDDLHLRLHALDGDEFVVIGSLGLHIPSERAQMKFAIDRMIGANTEEPKKWVEISDDICIVIGVSAPFVDRRTNMLSEPSFVDVRDDMGLSDITQYVDLVGIDAD
jgi:hypothetical protein